MPSMPRWRSSTRSIVMGRGGRSGGQPVGVDGVLVRAQRTAAGGAAPASVGAAVAASTLTRCTPPSLPAAPPAASQSNARRRSGSATNGEH